MPVTEKLKFDLSKFDQSYFDRLRGRVVALEQRRNLCRCLYVHGANGSILFGVPAMAILSAEQITSMASIDGSKTGSMTNDRAERPSLHSRRHMSKKSSTH